jgi:dissimilatory sulfite reductase (desulfoviridin) alpha/beta subunit
MAHYKPAAERKYSPKAEKKITKVMHEYGKGKLHSGSKKGPIVSNVKQAQAIAISEAKRKGLKAGERWKKSER